MQRRLLIIHNPNAGNMHHTLLGQVVERLRASAWDVTIRQAQCDRTGRAMASRAAREESFDVIAAAGGDGTIRSVGAGLRGSGIPLGIVPVGTGNVMAHELGLRRDAESVAECLSGGRWVETRGALANGEPFFLMAGVGLDAVAVAELNQRLKRRIGKLAYVVPVLKALFRPLPDLRIDMDGETRRASWVVVCKASHYAGGFVLSPASSVLVPGIVTVMSTARTSLGLIADIFAVGMGRPQSAPNLKFESCRHVVIRSAALDKAIHVQVDGESCGYTPLEVQEDGPELRLLVPPKSALAANATTRVAA